MTTTTITPAKIAPARKPFYKDLSVLVLIAIAIGIVFGYAYPKLAIEMQPLGTAFIKMIR